MNSRALLVSTLIGGFTMAVLSNIPMVNLANCLFCFWLWAGGILAVYLYRRFSKSPEPLSLKEDLMIGLVSGIFGAVFATLLALMYQSASQEAIMRFLNEYPQFSGQLHNLLDIYRSPSNFTSFVLFTNLFFYPLFGLIGGMIGGALFKKPAVS